MSLLYKPFDRCIDPWHRVFCFGHFFVVRTYVRICAHVGTPIAPVVQQ